MNATLAFTLTLVFMVFTAVLIWFTLEIIHYAKELKKIAEDFHVVLAESFERERKLAKALIDRAEAQRLMPNSGVDQVSNGEEKQEVHEEIVPNPQLRQL